MNAKTVVMIPTYNEKDNIGRLLAELLALRIKGHDLHPLVVDDNSPDGTAQIVSELASRKPSVHLLLRTTERGRGSAGIAGFNEALRLGADYIIEMDADYSHDPKHLAALLELAEAGADVVLGSRFVNGGSDDDRSLYRQTVTKLAGVYIRTVLGLRVRDVSSGFRCFRRSALERIGLDSLISTGPSIVFEILYKCSVKGMKIAETPIVFIDRRLGVTKLDVKILIKSMVMVAHFRSMKERNRLFTPSRQTQA